jgi:nicotinate dehydrogenase subunit B
MTSELSRRAFISSTGAFVVGLATADWAAAATGEAGRSLKPDRLDSYIAIEKDGTITAYYGKIDGGQGLGTSIAQMVAEELDVPLERVHLVMGDTGARSTWAAPAPQPAFRGRT